MIYLVRVRWWRAPARERHAVAPVVAVGSAMYVLLAAAGIAVAAGLSPLAQGLDFGYFTALAALPFALLASLQRRRAARSEAVGRLAERLGSVVGPDELRARTEIRHDERLLAAIAHDPSIHEDGGLGPAARAALERERLAVALRANVRELRESRAADRPGGRRRAPADRARPPRLRGLTDRVEALDGQLSVASSPDTGTTLRAEIPCGW